MRLVVCLVCLVSITGCAPGGGGGGGDCREAEHGCSEGFRCVAVGGGASYGCRAACSTNDECLRDELCEGGLCVDRPPRVQTDAEPEADATEVILPPPDAEVDGPPIRVVDAEPPDSGVVVLPPRDAAVDPAVCARRFDASGAWIAGIALGFAPGSPVFYRVELDVTPDATSMDLRFSPLRTRDRSVIAEQTVELVGVPIDGDGAFETGTLTLRSPAEANRLGGDVVFDIDLIGALRPSGALCGGGEGVTVVPRGRSLDGTRFAFARWLDPAAGIDPFAACDGCLP